MNIFSRRYDNATDMEKEAMENMSKTVVTEEVLKTRTSTDLEGLISIVKKVQDEAKNGNFDSVSRFMNIGPEIIQALAIRYSANHSAFTEGTSVDHIIKKTMEEIENEK